MSTYQREADKWKIVHDDADLSAEMVSILGSLQDRCQLNDLYFVVSERSVLAENQSRVNHLEASGLEGIAPVFSSQQSGIISHFS